MCLQRCPDRNPGFYNIGDFSIDCELHIFAI